MKKSHQIFQMVFEQEDIMWQSMLYQLVRTEQMDPWDIDVSIITNKFLVMLKKMKEMDLRIPGKVLLASAILLKLKSKRLVETDLVELDRLIAGTGDMTEEEFYDELEDQFEKRVEIEDYRLIPRTPQPRKRKVSIYDLVDALQKALEVKRRRVEHSIPEVSTEVPKKSVDITRVIKELYGKIKIFFNLNKGKRLTFSQLIPSPSKEDKAVTFIPLLHLAHQRKVHLDQKEHFGEIEIFLRTKREVEKELV